MERVFGKVLRERRLERNVSQAQLALQAGLDRTFVSLLERGLRLPTLKTLFALAAALDTTPSALVAAVELRLQGRVIGTKALRMNSTAGKKAAH